VANGTLVIGELANGAPAAATLEALAAAQALVSGEQVSVVLIGASAAAAAQTAIAHGANVVYTVDDDALAEPSAEAVVAVAKAAVAQAAPRFVIGSKTILGQIGRASCRERVWLKV
jgi:electron transfer flavoprotein alpha subunit